MRPLDRQLLLLLNRPKGGKSGRPCEKQGCNQTTREGKPFCSDHVDEHPYVRDLLADLAAREEDEERILSKRTKGVDINGPTVTTVLAYLEQNGTRTIERMVRDTQIDERAMEHIVTVLKKHKRITTGRTNRGSTTVKLLRKPPANGEHPD